MRRASRSRSAKIFEVAQTVDANTMRLQYLDALKQIGSSDATKIVLPMEVADALARIAGDRS